MKIVARFAHFAVELDPVEVDDATLEQLLDGIRGGAPVSFAVVEAIVRSTRAAKLAKPPRRG
jgi:hypothetical protein